MSHSRAEVAPDGYDPRALRLPDGRDLAYCLYGREDGTPVLFFYGTPGTMFLAPDRLVPVDQMGIRLLVADRPGYGASTRLAGRSVVSPRPRSDHDAARRICRPPLFPRAASEPASPPARSAGSSRAIQ
jgi:pimeloyl-ACP methyl ester carboxylesterase